MRLLKVKQIVIKIITMEIAKEDNLMISIGTIKFKNIKLNKI